MATDLAKVIVKNKSGKYLILRSSEWPENPKRSLQPDLPGGVVEEGEDPAVGAAREVHEEAGIVVDPTDLTLVYDAPEVHDGREYRRYIYTVTLANDPEITLSWEHDKFWWKSAQEVIDLTIREPYPTIFNQAKEAGYLS